MKKLIIICALCFIFLIGAWIVLFDVLFPLKYKEEILIAGQTYSVDPVLIASVINAESSFDYKKVSAKNAVGLMQLLPSTAESLTEEDVDLFNPKTNITLGVKYLAYLIDKFNDIDTALFAYNAGEGNVSRWLTEQKTDKLKSCPFKETNAYVSKIKKSLKFYRYRI